MSSEEHLLHVYQTAKGQHGVFRALGGYLPGVLTADNLTDLVMVIEPIGELEALRRGRMPRSEEKCREMCAEICRRANQ